MRPGIKILEDVPGPGEVVERHRYYRIRLRLWLSKGERVRWEPPLGVKDGAVLEDEGRTLVTDVRLDRGDLINGLFYGIEGMRVGGTRRLKISPHLAYREQGVPGVIPANAVLVAEVIVVSEKESRGDQP